MSPSLKAELEAVIADETGVATRRAIDDLTKYGEVSPATARQMRAARFTAEQIFDDWLPPEPPA